MKNIMRLETMHQFPLPEDKGEGLVKNVLDAIGSDMNWKNVYKIEINTDGVEVWYVREYLQNGADEK